MQCQLGLALMIIGHIFNTLFIIQDTGRARGHDKNTSATYSRVYLTTSRFIKYSYAGTFDRRDRGQGSIARRGTFAGLKLNPQPGKYICKTTSVSQMNPAIVRCFNSYFVGMYRHEDINDAMA